MVFSTRRLHFSALTAGLLVGGCGLAVSLPASAHPLLRLHVRPAAYRVAMPRLSAGRMFSFARQAAGLVPQAAVLTAPASVARAVLAQAPGHGWLGRH